MLQGIDFNLKLSGFVSGCSNWCIAIKKLDGLTTLFYLAIKVQPLQSVADCLQQGLDGAWLQIDEVDIFRIAQRLGHQEFVDGGATTECQLSLKSRMTEQIVQGSTDDQILFHLPRVWPWSLQRPGLNEPIGDQSSSSSVWFTSSFQVESRGMAGVGSAHSGSGS